MLKKVYRKAHRVISRYLFTNGKVNEMLQSEDPIVKNMGEIFQESLSGKLSETEKEYVDQIESLRSEYLHSNERIKIDGSSQKELISKLVRVASKKSNWGILISKIIRNFDIKNALEIGTCIGISTSYHAFALQKNEGKILTLEGSKHRINQAKKTFSKLNLSNIEVKQGNFNVTLDEALQSASLFDYAFIDGDHRYESTLENFKKILSHVDGTFIVLVDDIQWSSGMIKAWNEIVAYDKSTYVFDLFNVGIIISGSKKDQTKIKLALW